MHRLLALSLLLVGCDAVGGNAAADAMADLDGLWRVDLTREQIAGDGTVTPQGAETFVFEVGRVVECNRTTVSNVSDEDRVAVQYQDPNGHRTCSVIKTDGDARRIVFVGTVWDQVGTIRELSPSRHVWDFYVTQSGGAVIRARWTLTPAR